MSEEKDIRLEALVEKCKTNDRKAQEELYRYFYPLMMPICMGYGRQPDDAVDIFNQSFLKVFLKLKDYKGDGAFAGWVRQIIVRTAIDFVRREDKRKNNVDIDQVGNVSSHDNPMERVLTEDVLHVMQQLPPVQRLVVNLYIIEGYTHEEIADQLNIRPGTSKWHLSEGRKRLKTLLTKAGIAH